ncbi:hypothetical protein JHV675_54210 [Mycobacterium avium subsp. hominissuis]
MSALVRRPKRRPLDEGVVEYAGVLHHALVQGTALGRRTRADTPRRGSAFSAVRSPVSA